MSDKAENEFHSQSPGRRTQASLILFVVAATIVLLDIIGPIFLSGGYDIISSRLHDQLAFLAVLSVPFILILLVVGSILGILEWRAARRASVPPPRITVIAACLNLTLLLIGILVVAFFLVTVELNVPS
jgi:hypothetical protein